MNISNFARIEDFSSSLKPGRTRVKIDEPSIISSQNTLKLMKAGSSQSGSPSKQDSAIDRFKPPQREKYQWPSHEQYLPLILGQFRFGLY